MPTIDVNDFWTQALAAIVAALFMLLIRPQWLQRPDKNRTLPGQSEAGNHNQNGNQANLKDTTISGDLHLDQSYTDRSQQTTIINNLNSAPKPTSSDDDLGKLALLCSLAVAAACFFVGAWPVLLVASFAAVAAVILMIVVAALRTRRMLHRWPPKAIATVVIGVLACAAVALSWWGVRSLHRNGMSLDVIAAAIPKISEKQGSYGPFGYMDYFISTVVPAFFGSGEYVLHFVLLLLLGIFASFMLTLFAWQHVLEWHSYLRFNLGAQQSDRITKEAKAFQEGKVLFSVLSAIIIGGIAFSCSVGIPFDLLKSTMSQAPSSGAVDSSK